MKTFRFFADNEWHVPASGRWFESENPRHRRSLGAGAGLRCRGRGPRGGGGEGGLVRGAMGPDIADSGLEVAGHGVLPPSVSNATNRSTGGG